MSKNLKFKGSQPKNAEKKITNIALRNAQQKVYISFNWSFITTNNSYNLKSSEFTTEHSHLLVKRLFELSEKDVVSITANYSKKIGLEKLPKSKLSNKEKLKNLEIHKSFNDSVRKELAGEDFWVFRLCPNNNPYESRIVGKMIDDVFYVMFIDYRHELYAKRA